jgi:hypothetical protein
MNRRSPASELYFRACCSLLFFIAAAASFQGFYTKWHFREPGVLYGAGTSNERRFGLPEILDGTASRPFVYRQLVPSLANSLDRLIPREIKTHLYQSASNESRFSDILLASPVARNPAYFFRYSIVYVVTFLFAWLSVFAMYLVCRAVDFPPAVRVFAPVVMILLFPYFMSNGGYFYDYPELAFLALAVWMALKFDWWWMLPLVAVATWNKESFLLIIPTLFPILRQKNSRVSALIGTGALALASAGVYFNLRLRFQGNPGGTVLHEWRDQLRFLAHPLNFLRWEKTYGIPAFKAFTLIPLILIVWTALRGWRRLPLEIQRHGQIAALINFPLFFLFCAPGEIRDLSLLYIVFLLLLAANFTTEPKPLVEFKKNEFEQREFAEAAS